MDADGPATDSSPTQVAEFVDETGLPPVRLRELLAIAFLIVLCDLTIYRGRGFAGYAILFVLLPWCLALGSPQPFFRPLGWLFVALLTGLAARLAWCGSSLAIGCGFTALVAYAMSLAGRTPYVLAMIAFVGQTLAAGAQGLNHYGRSAHRDLQPVKTSAALSVVMPLAALLLFGSLFVMANPDLVSSVSSQFHLWVTGAQDWLKHFSVLEIPFWIATAWVSIGLLRPALDTSAKPTTQTIPVDSTPTALSAPLYAPFRNTLVTLIVLFIVYLTFEFQTLWFREFPKGFHFSGYAHEGAAWLTFALALATLTLSLIFRGEVLRDARLPQLKWLAWTWSLLNLLLAVAVYNRLCIYVGFNGMTRMRMVGFFGTTAVVIGFLLAVHKISRQRDFVWLFRADLWALLATVFAYALTPVDLIVMRYNVHRILAGDSAPSVQISVHPIDAEGVRELLPLVHCPDEIVREGVKSLLANRWQRPKDENPWSFEAWRESARRSESKSQRLEDVKPRESAEANEPWTWNEITSYQLSERLLAEELAAIRTDWEVYLHPARQNLAWSKFRSYAYQWY